MSWQRKDDLGAEFVAHVNDSLKVTERYRVDIGRGFQWWASDYCQTVWSDPGVFHNLSSIHRVHTEIELLRGNGHAGECEIPLLEAMADATLSAMVYDAEKDTYKLHCSIYAHNENAEWLKRVFIGAVGLQIAEAHRVARDLATKLKLSPATSSHPLNGMRNQADPMVEAVDRFFKPFGATPSKWLGSPEWEEARMSVRRLSQRAVTDERSCLEADFDWHHGSDGIPIKLTISADEPHRELGNGLHMMLRVPVNMVPGSRAHIALHLNEMERREWNWCNDIGSWCTSGEDLAFVCFVPNISFAPEVLTGLTHDMGIRAKWLNEQWANMVSTASAV